MNAELATVAENHPDIFDREVIATERDRVGYHIAPEAARQHNKTIDQYKQYAKVMALGWEPWTPSREWHIGAVEYGNCNVGFHALVCLAITAAILLSVAWAMVTISVGWSLAFSFLFFPGVYAIGVGVEQFKGQWSREQRDKIFSRGGETDWRGFTRPMLYQGAMPETVWRKYRQELTHFDRCYIASTDEKAFKEGRVYISDPLLLGKIGDQWFLGAQWDLTKDLAPVIGAGASSG